MRIDELRVCLKNDGIDVDETPYKMELNRRGWRVLREDPTLGEWWLYVERSDDSDRSFGST